MGIRRRARHSVVIETPADLDTGTNEYGDEDETVLEYWDVADAVKAYVEVSSSSEQETDRETQGQRFNVFLPPEVAITGYSRVRFTWLEDEELLARVIGEPLRHSTATRGPSHTVAIVEVVT